MRMQCFFFFYGYEAPEMFVTEETEYMIAEFSDLGELSRKVLYLRKLVSVFLREFQSLL